MVEQKNLRDKYGPWALVIGASTGLGASWARECAKRGMNVAICARRLNKLQEVSSELRENYSVETLEFVVDIAAPDAADTIRQAVSGLDIGMVIYNAAVERAAPFIKMREEYHLQQIAGNAVTPMRICYHFCREMARKHRGCILLLSSMSASAGTSNHSTYSACKSFMMQLGETLWYEMGKYGVDVSGVMVGSVVTPEFIRIQTEQGTNMTAGQAYDLSDIIGDLQVDPACMSAQPHLCDEVASYVMDHVGEGPRLYTHPEDQLANEAYGRMDRRDGTLLLSRVTDKFFSAGHSEDLTEDAEEFIEIRKM